MKKLLNNVLSLAIIIFISTPTSAQLPFIQHLVPSGVTINNARMNEIAIDASNNKWIAFGNYGLGIYDNTAWTMFNTVNSTIPTDSIICVEFDGSGNAWVGSKEGAIYKVGNTFTTFDTSSSGIPGNVVTDILVDGDTTWFGTYKGLAYLFNNNWVVYDTNNSGLENDSITRIIRDGSGILWVGTRNGLMSYNGTLWSSYTTSNSPLSRFIIDLEWDSSGRIWISCGTLGIQSSLMTQGVYYLNNGQLNNFHGDFFNYDYHQVLYTKGLNFAKDSNGNIYFKSNIIVDGIVRIDGTTMDHYILQGINFGVQVFGSIFEFDNMGLLWTVPRYMFYFYSLNFSGYNYMLQMISYKNHRTLDINDVVAGINVGGDMHWDLSNSKYEVPKGFDKTSVFASALWMGGVDQGGQIHIAAQTYRQTGIDFWPGPISGIAATFDSASCIQFDRIWKMNKWKVEEFKNQFQAGNIANGTYEIPEEIATWPSKGNGLVSGNLAPFVDFNFDGIYNPNDGDYPEIKGDQMLFYVFNDSLAPHSETNGLKLGIEIQASVYAYNCQNIADSNLVLNRTTLYSYKIINRSTMDYDSVYIGLWSDMDLGNQTDDLVGCDTTRAAGFTYNGDNDDDGSMGYGLNPPMQNVKILRGTIADFSDGTDNDLDGVIDELNERTSMNHFQYYNNINNSPIGNPNGAQDFYNYLRSYWLDGQHVSYGGDGYNSSITQTNFMYSGAPYAGSGWSEISAGSIPEDRRFVMSSGPITLEAGDSAFLDFAYVFSRDELNPNGISSSIARNNADLDRIQYWFDNNNFPSCEVYSTGLQSQDKKLVELYPNPATDFLFVKGNGRIKSKSFAIYNLMGELVKEGFVQSGRINIEYLKSQIYIIRLESETGFQHFRFIKM